MGISKSLFAAFLLLAVAASAAPAPGLHPGFTLKNLRPAGLQPDVGGMDFLPDGSLALATWGGERDELDILHKTGKLIIVKGVLGPNPSPTFQQVAGNLEEPLGLKVVDGEIFLTERRVLSRFSVSGQRLGKVADAPGGDARSEWFYGLEYRDGWFYANLPLHFKPGGAIADPQLHPDRGTTVRISKADGKREVIAAGFRTHDGITLSPDGEIFITDNQGGWMPSSTFTHVVQGRNYGVRPVLAPFSSQPVTRPTAWMPHNEISESPGQPIHVPHGLYRGQYFVTDPVFGGLQRVFLDKVGGEYNGCVFAHTQGLEAGSHRVVWGPDGALYVGGCGTGRDWHQPGKLFYGLQKLAFNDNTPFEMLAVRSRQGGMEIEFTKETGASAAVAANYEVRRWTFIPSSVYGGGNKQQNTLLSVKAVRVHEDKKRVFLEVDNLQAGNWLTYIRLKGVQGASGQSSWNTEAWYTMLKMGTEPPFSTPPVAARQMAHAMPWSARTAGPGRMRIKVADGGDFNVSVHDLQGKRVAQGRGPGEVLLRVGRGTYLVRLEAGTSSASRTVVVQ